MSWLPKLSHKTFLGLSVTNKYPNKFLGLYKLSQCISWFSQAIPVELLFYPNYFMFLSSAVTHWFVAILRVCSGMNMFEFALGWCLNLALDGLQLEYAPAPMGNNAWSGKVARSDIFLLRVTLQQNLIETHSNEFSHSCGRDPNAKKCGLCYCPVLLSNGCKAQCGDVFQTRGHPVSPSPIWWNLVKKLPYVWIGIFSLES